MNGKIAYAGGLSADTGRLPSPSLWQNCPFDQIASGTKDGVVLWEDFVGNFAQATNVAAGSGIKENGFVAFTGNDAGNIISQETDEPYGVTTLLLTGDNLSTILAGLGAASAGQITLEAGKKTWMEARVKVSSVTDDRGGFFIGLAEEGLCVTLGLIGNDDAMTDKDYVGFHRLAGDGDKLDFVYNTASGSTSPVTHLADAVTLVADTYVKVGIYCDGTSVYFYVNGQQVGDAVALTATDFPNGEEMCVYFGGTNKGTTANSLSVDWVRVAELRA